MTIRNARRPIRAATAVVRATALAGAVLTATTPALAIEGDNRPPLEGHLAIMALPPFGDIPYVVDAAVLKRKEGTTMSLRMRVAWL